MELNFSGIRDPFNRTEFGVASSEAIIEFMNTHFNMARNTCAPTLSVNENTLNVFPEFYQNPVKKGGLFYINNLANKTRLYYLG